MDKYVIVDVISYGHARDLADEPEEEALMMLGAPGVPLGGLIPLRGHL